MRGVICGCAAASFTGSSPDAETGAGASSRFSPQCGHYGGAEEGGGFWGSLCSQSHFLSHLWVSGAQGRGIQTSQRAGQAGVWHHSGLHVDGKTTNSPPPIGMRALVMSSCWGGGKRRRRDIPYFYRRGPRPKEGAWEEGLGRGEEPRRSVCVGVGEDPMEYVEFRKAERTEKFP